MRYRVIGEVKTPQHHFIPAAPGTDALVIDSAELDGPLGADDWVRLGALAPEAEPRFGPEPAAPAHTDQ